MVPDLLINSFVVGILVECVVKTEILIFQEFGQIDLCFRFMYDTDVLGRYG